MKRMIMRTLGLLGGGLLAALLITGCSQKSSSSTAGAGRQATDPSKTTIRMVWWGSDRRHNITLEAIKLFEQANPDIKITPEYMGSDSYWDKLAVQVAGSTAPDIIQFGGNYPDYVAKDALLELDQYKGNLLDLSAFDQDVLETGSMNGHLYGICLGTNALALVYNKSLLEKIGADLPKETMSWDELRLYALSIMPKLPAGVYPLVDNSSNQTNYLGYFLRQNNTPLYRNGTSQAKIEDLEKWIALWENFRADNIIPDAETVASFAETSPDSSLLVAGRAAIGLIWSNQFSAYQGAMTDELALIQLPDIEKDALWVQPSQYLCVNKKSTKPEAAVKFINFFVNNPEVGKVLGNDRGISSSQVVRDAIAVNADTNDKKVYAFYAIATKHTTPMDPNLPNDQEFNNTFKLFTQRVAFGQLTVRQGAEQSYNLIQQLLKK